MIFPNKGKLFFFALLKFREELLDGWDFHVVCEVTEYAFLDFCFQQGLFQIVDLVYAEIVVLEVDD
jgi:hypothetical protein